MCLVASYFDSLATTRQSGDLGGAGGIQIGGPRTGGDRDHQSEGPPLVVSESVHHRPFSLWKASVFPALCRFAKRFFFPPFVVSQSVRFPALRRFAKRPFFLPFVVSQCVRFPSPLSFRKASVFPALRSCSQSVREHNREHNACFSQKKKGTLFSF